MSASPTQTPERVQTRLMRDQAGQVPLEYMLILGAIAIPMLVVFRYCLAIIVGEYRMMTFLNSLPFP